MAFVLNLRFAGLNDTYSLLTPRADEHQIARITLLLARGSRAQLLTKCN